MNKPIFVTFTGVDEYTDLNRMVKLSSLYPIEWGVLIGGNPAKNRYPELTRVNEVSKLALDHNLNCALHLCGVFATQAKQNNIPSEIDISGFKRFQVNAIEYDFDQLGKLAKSRNKDVIFQHRFGDFPLNLPERVYPLHDQSGGKGKVPTSRPDGTGLFVGYAGGISVDNVAEILSQIPSGQFWIDMETSLRIDDRFDLDICEKICRIIFD